MVWRHRKEKNYSPFVCGASSFMCICILCVLYLCFVLHPMLCLVLALPFSVFALHFWISLKYASSSLPVSVQLPS